MKKRLSALTLALVLLFAGSSAILAQSEIFLAVNGKKVETDAPCFIENDRTLVPIRFVGESLDYEVTWDKVTKQVTIINKKEDAQVSKIELVINSDKALIYDQNQVKKEMTLDAPAKIVKDRTFVPIRFIGESFGTPIDWDKDNRVVIIGDKTNYNPAEFAKLRNEKQTPAKPSPKAVPNVSGIYMQDPDSGLFFLVREIGKNKYGFTHEVTQTQVNPFVGRERTGLHGYFVQDPKTGNLIHEEGIKLAVEKEGLVLTGKGVEGSIHLLKMDPEKTYRCQIGEWYFNDGALSFKTIIR